MGAYKLWIEQKYGLQLLPFHFGRHFLDIQCHIYPAELQANMLLYDDTWKDDIVFIQKRDIFVLPIRHFL